MTNLEFRTALKEGKTLVEFTNTFGEKSIHQIIKAGKVQVTLRNTFERYGHSYDYNISFGNFKEGYDHTMYKLI